MSPAPASAPPPPPPKIPGYEIGELLGKGGMASVWRARAEEDGRAVAVKWLASSAPEVLRKRFAREAKAASSLRHPHIVSILGSGETSAGSFIVMELVDGFPLSTALDSRALGRNALVDLVAKVARGLALAHEKGILHRDVKPANILVDEKGEPRLVDFGLCRFVDGQETLTAITAPGAIVGTFGTMSPEVLSGGGTAATRASDVFSLGCVLYEGLVQRSPFGSGATAKVIGRFLEGKTEPLPETVPKPLAEICHAMLAREPEKRPSAQDAAARLEAFLKSQATRRLAPRKHLGLVPIVVVLVAFVLSIVAGVIVSTLFSR